MEKSSKRGKIPQQDWPSIIARYEGGETLASIARTYDCSPPAISYIVSRTRARAAPADATAAMPPEVGPEPSSTVATPSIDSMAGLQSVHVVVASDAALPSPAAPKATAAPERSTHTSEASEARSDPPHVADGLRLSNSSPPSPRPGPVPREHDRARTGYVPPAANGQGESPPTEAPRRTLHLSLSSGNGAAGGSETHPAAALKPGAPGAEAQPQVRPAAGFPGHSQPARTTPPLPFGPRPDPLAPARASITPADASPAKEGGTFIDRALRDRISGDIEAFLAAFDAALDHDTAESRSGLREATDRLLRAGARTRIELERLEARVPLPGRDRNAAAPLLRAR
jgi:hypothetical protein